MIKYKIRYEENIFVTKKLNNEKQEYSIYLAKIRYTSYHKNNIYLVLKKLDIFYFYDKKYI